MSETILVIGASGLLGRQVYKLLSEKKEFTVIGTALHHVQDPLVCLDSTNKEEVETLIKKHHITLIINCAAIRYPDQIEKNKQLSEDINIHSVEILCQLCKQYNIYLIHISTDYVFDETKPPYSVSDKPNPLNEYGKQKYQSEQVCLKNYSLCTVIRVPILYGPTTSLKESAVTVLYESIKQKSPKIDNVAIRYPTFTCDVAFFIYNLITRFKEDNEYKGILHFSAKEPYTKYQMSLEMCRLLHMNSNHIVANETENPGAARPKDAHLQCDYVIDGQPFPYTYPL